MTIDTNQQINDLTHAGVIEDVSDAEAIAMGAFSETSMPLEDALAAAAEAEGNDNAH